MSRLMRNLKIKFPFYLRNQLLLIMALIMLAFGAGIFVIVFSYNRVVTRKIGTISQSYVSAINSSLDLLESNTRQISSLLKNSSILQTALSSKEYTIDKIYTNDTQVRSSLINILHSSRNISMIYVGNSLYEYQARINSSLAEHELNYAVIQKALEGTDEQKQFYGLWMTSASLGFSSRSTSLFFLQKIRNLNTLRSIGYIIIEVKPSFLDEAAGHEYIDTGINVAFLKDDLLLYQNGTLDPEEIFALSETYAQKNESDVNFFPIRFRHTQYYLALSRNSLLDLDLISLIPAGLLTGDLQQLYLLVGVVLTFLLVVLVIITWRFSSSVISQVTQIKTLFLTNSGSRSSALPFRDNEIGQIGMECENLLKRYDRSTQHTYELAIKQKETELLRLQEQINPHFLYNTLNSIYWMCQSGETEKAATMTLYLSRYFRSNLRQNTVVSTIAEELRRIENYLAIQNIRYQNKFELITEIDPSLMDTRIMRMLLQPLIENAIFHGLEPKEGKGTIRLTAGLKDGWLIICVSDDGVGFMEENLIKGLAMKNIEERIILFYGSSCGMQISSQPGVGTTVTLTLLKEINQYV